MGACCCIDIGDSPSVYLPRMVTARKPHRCCECGEEIKPGDKYEITTGCWDGRWDTFKTCEFCHKIWRDFFDCGWIHGGLAEAFYECYGWDYRTLPDDDDDDNA